MSFPRKSRFSRRIENLVVSIPYATEPKPNTLKKNFLLKKCLWRPYLSNDDQKGWNFLYWGAQEDKNLGFWGYFEVQATYLPLGIHQPPKVAGKGISVFCNIPSNFKSKFWQENFIWEKIKISTRWLSSFQALFLAITSNPLKLAAFPRSLKPQYSSLNILSHSAPH